MQYFLLCRKHSNRDAPLKLVCFAFQVILTLLPPFLMCYVFKKVGTFSELHGEPSVVHCPYDYKAVGSLPFLNTDLQKDSNSLLEFHRFSWFCLHLQQFYQTLIHSLHSWHHLQIFMIMCHCLHSAHEHIIISNNNPSVF